MSTIGLENQQVPGVRDAITAAEKAGEKAEGATKEAAKAAAEAKRAADYADEAIGTAQEAIQVAEEATEATNNATNTLNEKIEEINESLETVKEAADVAMGMEEKLDNEIAARESDRDNLQTNINNVMNKEIMDVNFLQENINKEVEARIAGDKAQADALQAQSDSHTAEINDVKADVQANTQAIAQNAQSIAQAQNNIANINNEITEIRVEADDAYDKDVQVDTAVSGNDSTVTITKTIGSLKDDNTQDTELPLPVASETQAGVINPATYKQIQDASEKIAILMSNIVLDPTLPANPTSAQISEAYKTLTGSDTIPNGARITGSDGVTYVYYANENAWVQSADTGGTVDVKPFTNTAAGTIKGSEEDGKVFAESDGSGSVNGWDDLVARANSHDSEIENIKTDLATENTRTQNLPTQVVYNTSLSEYAADKVTTNLVMKDLHTGGDASLPVEITGATTTRAGVMTAQHVADLNDAHDHANQLATSIDTLETTVDGLETTVGGLSTSVENLGTTVDGIDGRVDTLETQTEEILDELPNKQDTLVSGTNIKTVNGESVLGSGDITLGGGGLSEVYYKFGSAADYSKTGAELISIDLPSTGVYWVSFYVYTSSNAGTTEVYLNQGSKNYPGQYNAMYQRRTITQGNLDGVSSSGLVQVSNTHLAVMGKHSGGNVLCMDSSIVAIKMS